MTIDAFTYTCMGSVMLSFLIMVFLLNVTRLATWAISLYHGRWS